MARISGRVGPVGVSGDGGKVITWVFFVFAPLLTLCCIGSMILSSCT